VSIGELSALNPGRTHEVRGLNLDGLTG
jgi:hypothetical protein